MASPLRAAKGVLQAREGAGSRRRFTYWLIWTAKSNSSVAPGATVLLAEPQLTVEAPAGPTYTGAMVPVMPVAVH